MLAVVVVEVVRVLGWSSPSCGTPCSPRLRAKFEHARVQCQRLKRTRATMVAICRKSFDVELWRKWGCHASCWKTGWNQKHATVSDKCLQKGIHNLKVWHILCEIIQWCFSSFLGSIFDRFPNSFAIFFSILFMICFVCSRIILELADLCKYAPRRDGSMVFEFSVASLWYFHDFLAISHLSVRLIWVFVFGCILDSFWMDLLSLWWSKGCQHVINKRCENWHRKK